MKKNLVRISLVFIMCLSTIVTSCTKLLDEKPNQAITTINTFKDLQGILRHPNLIGFGIAIGDLGSDQILQSNSSYASMFINYQNGYRWDKETLLDQWITNYQCVYAANNVLKEMERIKEGTKAERDELRGHALFLRSFAFHMLTQVYCAPYGEDTKGALGLPLRLTPNVEEKITRSSLEETYSKLIADMKESIELLPLQSAAANLPSKVACYGFLSRVYLTMRIYSEAEKYANLYLNEKPTLLDYNTLDTLANPSLPRTNIECVFDASLASPTVGTPTTANPLLIESYNSNDLRKKVLFNINAAGIALFKGSYNRQVSSTPYCGIATDEIYLIRAECRIRANHLDDGVKDLNFLLSKRWKTNKLIPAPVSTKEVLLQRIFAERYMELVYRGTRWSDLRRLNADGAGINLTRVVNGVTYTLPANDKRWVWLIPVEAVRLAGIQQNER